MASVVTMVRKLKIEMTQALHYNKSMSKRRRRVIQLITNAMRVGHIKKCLPSSRKLELRKM